MRVEEKIAYREFEVGNRVEVGGLPDAFSVDPKIGENYYGQVVDRLHDDSRYYIVELDYPIRYKQPGGKIKILNRILESFANLDLFYDRPSLEEIDH